MQLTKPIAEQRTIEQQRKTHEALLRLVPVPKNLQIRPLDTPDIEAQWLCPVEGDCDNMLLYFHGGGYVMGTVFSAKAVASKISAQSGIGALTFHYRLAPEFPFPAALEDAYAIYMHMLEQKIAPENIAFVGESAGGGLALGLCHFLKEQNKPLPRALALLSPWTDLTLSSGSYQEREEEDPVLSKAVLEGYARLYTAPEQRRSPYVSPLLGSFAGFPPTLIHVGQKEILLDDSIGLYDKMLEQGVEVRLRVWEDMWHVFQGYGTPTSKEAVGEISAFLREQLQGSKNE